mgnify:FL=1
MLRAGAALLTIMLLGLIIGSLVPRTGTGPIIGGVGMEELRTACKLTSPDDRLLCQRVFRVDAAIDDGQCTAARVQARPILALPEGENPLHDKMRDYTLARLQPCEAVGDSAAAGANAGGEQTE